MATNNAANVSVGKPKAGGAIFVAPDGTAVPTDATTVLAPAYVNVGYASEDGVTNAASTENESTKAWGGDEVLNVRTSREETWVFTAIETNATSLTLVYGEDNVTADEGTGSIAVVHNNIELPNQVIVFEILMTGNLVKRVVLPSAKVTEVGDIVYADNQAIGYQVTLAALPDKNGNTAYEYIAAVS